MEQDPSSEADTYSASKKILRLLWNPKVHYRGPYPESDECNI